MSIKESALSIVQSIADSDYLRAVTSLGASRRVQASNVGKYVVETYEGSELAGEAQSVQDAFTAVESDISTAGASLLDKLKNSMITNTASGTIASFTDGSNVLPALSLVADINPVQDLNGYDAPWVVGAGKNKFDGSQVSTTNSTNWSVSWSNDVLTIVHNNTYSTGTPKSASMTLPQGTYCLSYVSSPQTTVDVYINGSWSKSLVSGGTFSVSQGDTAEIVLPNNQATTITYSKIQLEQGSTATTYTPYSNICPISGWGSVSATVEGFNLLDNDNIVENEYWQTSGVTASFSGRARSATPIRVLPNTAYYANWASNAGIYGVQMFDRFMNNVGQAMVGTDAQKRFTTPATAYYACINIINSQQDTASFNVSSDRDGEFEAYNGTTYTTTLGSTVYGGTLDVVSGVLTVTHALIDGGDCSWNYWYLDNFYATVSDKTAESITDIKCEIYGTTSGGYSGAPNGVFNQTSSDLTKQNIYIKDSTLSPDASGAAALKTKLTGHKIWYRLATPTTTQLTPHQVQTLLGNNNVFADSGNVSITYKADTK